MNITKLVNYYQYKSSWVLLQRFSWLQDEAPALRRGVKDVVTRWGQGHVQYLVRFVFKYCNMQTFKDLMVR